MDTTRPRTCPTCGKPVEKQLQLPMFSQPRWVRILCDCQEQAQQVAEARKQEEAFRCRQEAVERQHRITDLAYRKWRFQDDDSPDSAASVVCRRYVENWRTMQENNIGLLFYGTVGTGKTFYSSAVVNALQDQHVLSSVTSFPRILNLMQDSKDRQGLLDHLCVYDLLVIDDLGVERDSAYALEQVYAVLDARARAGKPLIITTNLSLQELKNPSTTAHGRIYDRVLSMCSITIKMTGPSRRTQQAEQARARAKSILLG